MGMDRLSKGGTLAVLMAALVADGGCARVKLDKALHDENTDPPPETTWNPLEWNWKVWLEGLDASERKPQSTQRIATMCFDTFEALQAEMGNKAHREEREKIIIRGRKEMQELFGKNLFANNEDVYVHGGFLFDKAILLFPHSSDSVRVIGRAMVKKDDRVHEVFVGWDASWNIVDVVPMPGVPTQSMEGFLDIESERSLFLAQIQLLRGEKGSLEWRVEERAYKAMSSAYPEARPVSSHVFSRGQMHEFEGALNKMKGYVFVEDPHTLVPEASVAYVVEIIFIPWPGGPHAKMYVIYDENGNELPGIGHTFCYVKKPVEGKAVPMTQEKQEASQGAISYLQEKIAAGNSEGIDVKFNVKNVFAKGEPEFDAYIEEYRARWAGYSSTPMRITLTDFVVEVDADVDGENTTVILLLNKYQGVVTSDY